MCTPQLVRAVHHEIPVDEVGVGLGVRFSDGATVVAALVEAVDAASRISGATRW